MYLKWENSLVNGNYVVYVLLVFICIFADPLMRAGDFISERMDILENTVKKSISAYNLKRHNSLRAAHSKDDYYYSGDYADEGNPQDHDDAYYYYAN